MRVALFTRAWIEIKGNGGKNSGHQVALFTRAWIEILFYEKLGIRYDVALFTRAWIEISIFNGIINWIYGRPLHEGVD